MWLFSVKNITNISFNSEENTEYASITGDNGIVETVHFNGETAPKKIKTLK